MNTPQAKNNSKVSAFAKDVLTLTPKKGVQIIEISSEELEHCHFTGSFRYTSHEEPSGIKTPVDYTFSLLSNPLTVVEGVSYLQKESAKILRKKISKSDPWVIDLNFDTDEGKALFFFLARHPQIFSDGYKNPNLTQPLLKLTLRTEQAILDFESIKNKRNIVDAVLAMDYEMCKSLIFHLGYRPFIKPKVYMTQIECKTFLIGKNFDGYALKKQKLFEEFWEERDTEGLRMKINFKKAVDNRLILKNHGVYETPGGIVLGNEEENVIAYFISNKSFYESVCEDISRAETSIPKSHIPLQDEENANDIIEQKRRGRPLSKK